MNRVSMGTTEGRAREREIDRGQPNRRNVATIAREHARFLKGKYCLLIIAERRRKRTIMLSSPATST